MMEWENDREEEEQQQGRHNKGVVSRWLKLPKRMMLMKQKQRIEHLEQSLKAATFESGGPES